MIGRGRGCYKMPCESCAVNFSVFKRKRCCSECERFYCSGCLRRGGGTMCAPCRVLSTRPLYRQSISHLKVRDLQCFLQRQNVSTRGCVEKEELLCLCVSHVNSAAYRRRSSRSGSSPFSTLKGITTNINDFINSAFDIRNPAHPAPPPTRSNCFNSSHLHSPQSPINTSSPSPIIPDQHFTTRPSGEADIEVPVPEPELSQSGSSEREPVDTNDCFEIEDLAETGWEFVTRPADPLPNDSDVLLSATPAAGAGAGAGLAAGGTPQRAASELDLRRRGSGASDDTGSLSEEPLSPYPMPNYPGYPNNVTLDELASVRDLDLLSVRQLKELLARNRVEFRGCVERAELQERAALLFRDYAKYRHELDKLPLEECCKICMAAPLECVLLECGHIAACTACAKQLAECPICRQYVVRAVRCFRS